MAKTLTATDRSALIRLASSMEAGDPKRLAILAGLARHASFLGDQYANAPSLHMQLSPLMSLNLPVRVVVWSILDVRRSRGAGCPRRLQVCAPYNLLLLPPCCHGIVSLVLVLAAIRISQMSSTFIDRLITCDRRLRL